MRASQGAISFADAGRMSIAEQAGYIYALIGDEMEE